MVMISMTVVLGCLQLNALNAIPLYSLPLLNSQNVRNGEVLVDQPAIGRRTVPDDEDEEEEGEADAEADGGEERLGRRSSFRYCLYSYCTRGALARARARGGGSAPSSIIIKPAMAPTSLQPTQMTQLVRSRHPRTRSRHSPHCVLWHVPLAVAN
ncbi:hypothetical protein F5888DRAFT_174243 [Russula emetica]|nr:hypothetical protein F5888DRAFT_174243 [Russula emetica]